MTRKSLSLTTIALLFVHGAAVGQTANEIAGTYTFVSAVASFPDGKRVEPFGPSLKGLYVFDSGGRFVFVMMRSELPKFASNNRTQGTPEENQAVVQGSLAGFGTHSVADKVMSLKFEGSTFPNWTGTEVKQNIVSFTGDVLKWTVAATGDGTAEVTLKRVK